MRLTGRMLAMCGVVVLLMVFGHTAMAKKKYVYLTITDEHRFMQVIGSYETVWVKYTFRGPRMDPVHQERGDRFWKVLKREFGGQVDAFIEVDCTGWSNYCAAAKTEIGKSSYPSFLLYRRGKVVNDGTSDDIRLRGVPLDQIKTKSTIEYLKKRSFLR